MNVLNVWINCHQLFIQLFLMFCIAPYNSLERRIIVSLERKRDLVNSIFPDFLPPATIILNGCINSMISFNKWNIRMNTKAFYRFIPSLLFIVNVKSYPISWRIVYKELFLLHVSLYLVSDDVTINNYNSSMASNFTSNPAENDVSKFSLFS